MYDCTQTLAADRSVNALWPLAAGCHHMYRIYLTKAPLRLKLLKFLDSAIQHVC